MEINGESPKADFYLLQATGGIPIIPPMNPDLQLKKPQVPTASLLLPDVSSSPSTDTTSSAAITFMNDMREKPVLKATMVSLWTFEDMI